ncbi:YhcN/YlaJ family sporulation lipoprotein [Bacillus sp. B190/17]|uniref:YhcN/YlaJ family sporulation lipoprotein n=1 Tax=Bacillus lumedeiriae TaxID=3058829 RepID=A0ABW8I4T5_9BACI
MQKTLKVFAVFSLTASLAACGTAKESGYGGTMNQPEQQGYYSDTGYEKKQDRYLRVGESDHPPNPTKPLAKEDRNFFERDNEHPHSRDVNYHGNRGLPDHRTKSSYYTNYNGRLAEQLAAKAGTVEGVHAVQTFINEKEIIIALQLTENSNAQTVKKQVKQTVADDTKGAKVKVTTNSGTFNYIRNLDNGLRDGGPIDLKDTRFSRDK